MTEAELDMRRWEIVIAGLSGPPKRRQQALFYERYGHNARPVPGIVPSYSHLEPSRDSRLFESKL
jgi:hypothetical protein